MEINEKLICRYKEIENKINPIVSYLEKNKDNQEYKYFYKGIATLLSPLIKNPEIMFLGINSGSGAWTEVNQQNNTNNTPLRMLSHDESYIYYQNDWFKPNTARGSWGKGKENKAFEWYQRDKPINNQFPVNMINILYEIAKIKYPTIKTNNFEEPLWTNEIKNNIIYTNLYPIITDDVEKLKRIHKLLSKEELLKEIFKPGSKSINEWDVRLFFIKNMDMLIELINPKVIVCLGLSAFNDYTYSNTKHNNQIFSTIKNNRPVIGFSRRGNWSHLIPTISEEILKHLKINF